jgi:ABC-type Fe3+-siderophore transport system permease subunit
MYSTKIFSGLCFFAGLLLLALGAYMNLNNILSTGQSYKTRLGTSMNAESIDGNGALFFGILILIVALISNRIYIFQKERERQKTGRRKYS